MNGRDWILQKQKRKSTNTSEEGNEWKRLNSIKKKVIAWLLFIDFICCPKINLTWDLNFAKKYTQFISMVSDWCNVTFFNHENNVM